MAKKKIPHRKYKFKHSEPGASATPGAVIASASAAASVRSGAMTQTTYRDFSYVTRDVRRLGIIAVILVILELSLWYLFGHTALGNGIYNFVKV